MNNLTLLERIKDILTLRKTLGKHQNLFYHNSFGKLNGLALIIAWYNYVIEFLANH